MRKKILGISMALIASFSTSSKAAEFGSYIGVNINQYYATADRNITSGDLQPEEILAGGVRAGYNFSLLGLFIAPEIYADYIGLDSYETTTQNNSIDINYQFGGKVNAGVSLLGIIDTYVTAGINFIDYEVNWQDSDQHKGDIAQGYIVGVGMNINPPIIDLLNLNLEANITNVDLETPNNTTYDTSIVTLKLGLTYQF
ncbi:MAG: outer membrane beta-barrel protein [Rickettsiales bacterium]|nr:outer membrane beta-barrel protein [Rickettsiales bacterium]